MYVHIEASRMHFKDKYDIKKTMDNEFTQFRSLNNSLLGIV